MLNATDALDAEWKHVVSAFGVDRARALAAAEKAKALEARARTDQSSASSAGMDVLLKEQDNIDWSAYDQARHQNAASEQIVKAGHRSRQARSELQAMLSGQSGAGMG